MKIEKRWILLALILLLIFGLKNTVKKESVAAINNQPCSKDTDCPCWGKYNVTSIQDATAYGIGIGDCKNSKCDMTWCVDVEDTGKWLREHPWNYLRENAWVLIAIIGLIIYFVMYPKT